MNSKILQNIWVINLDKSTDRIDKIKKNFSSLGLSFNRFSAIYGKNLSKNSINEVSTKICHTFLCNYSMLGCALSHITLWKQLLNSNEEYYLICEDDIVFDKKTIEIINKLEPFIKKFDIDFINLNCVNYGGCSFIKTIFTIDEYEFGKPIFPLGFTSYILTKKGAEKLINITKKINYHLDFQISFSEEYSKLNYFSSNIPLLKLTNEESTIGKKKTCLTIEVLELLNLKYLAWSLNVPIFVINLFYEINILMILLILLFIINNNYLMSEIILWFIILELIYLNLNYF